MCYVAASKGPITKRILLLRHGQAVHNPRAELAKQAGCSHEHFMELMRQDDALDAPLTELGEQQATKVQDRFGSTMLEGVDLVVSSPLSRALCTADLALPPSTKTGISSPQRRVCVEHFREINGWLLNAKRRDQSDLQKMFGHWDFSSISSTDETWTEKLESEEECAERGYLGLLWLMEQTESSILVTTHGGLLRFVMNQHPHVRMFDGRNSTNTTQLEESQNTSNDARCVKGRFGNCELREFTVTLEGTTENTRASESWRPIVTLTEITRDQVEEEEKDQSAAL